MTKKINMVPVKFKRNNLYVSSFLVENKAYIERNIGKERYLKIFKEELFATNEEIFNKIYDRVFLYVKSAELGYKCIGIFNQKDALEIPILNDFENGFIED